MKKLALISMTVLFIACSSNKNEECELSDQEITEYARSMAITKEKAIQDCLEMQRYADSVNAKQ